jgi:tetratricopeptide (TPR) repeat protein
MFALILMIRNEEKILKRCLEAVENLVEYFCICDTGSTDKSIEIACDFLKTHKGCVTTEPWKNFGYNRTIAFNNAQRFLRDEAKCDLEKVYGLLLDADMIFVSNNLKNIVLTELGYKIIQLNGALEYYNCRIIRMDVAWKCLGVTHEYWDGPANATLPKSVCYIDDKNDGGCKHDKFERDQKLLEQGIIDEPDNHRYLFYLAQTYKCLHKHKDAIKMYKKRIAAGGWYEEVWYSMYMIGQCYMTLKDFFKFEAWMQKAHAFHPHRSEPLHNLAEFFRVNGVHYKAFHYAKLGDSIPFPKNDVLFIETDKYTTKFLYEKTILDYYVNQDKKIGLRDSIQYLLRSNENVQNVLSNMKFYVSNASTVYEKLSLPSPFGDDFVPSAISISTYPFANVRYVNYWIQDGNYLTKDGVPVQTQNAYINLETNEVVVKMIDSSITLPRFETNVKGLEDIRLYKYYNTTKFTATSVKEYSQNSVRVVTGDYNLDGTFTNTRVLDSPTNSQCEKNWLPFPDSNMMIYKWSPFTIVDSQSTIVKQVQTPYLFSLFRGSAPPVRIEDSWICLVHFVEYSAIRNYYHCFVELNKKLEPVRFSLPFTFKSSQIEYCVSFHMKDKNTAECYTSLFDKNPHKITVLLDSIDWVVNLNEN